MKEIMVDIEALGKAPGGAIVSVGAVVFDGNEIVDKKYWLLDWEHQGRQYDASTLKWWFGQDKKAQEALVAVAGTTDTETFATEFYQLFKDHGTKAVWANGVSYDIQMLENMFRNMHLDNVTWDVNASKAGAPYEDCKLLPWAYPNVYCMRSLRNEFESVLSYRKFKSAMIASGMTAHNALDDAVIQTMYVQETRKWIASRR